jgi:hypothetical protein
MLILNSSMIDFPITHNKQVSSAFAKANSHVIKKYNCKTTEDLINSWINEFDVILDIESKILKFKDRKSLTLFSLKFS